MIKSLRKLLKKPNHCEKVKVPRFVQLARNRRSASVLLSQRLQMVGPSALFVCKKAHHTSCADTRFGLEQICNCKIPIKESRSILTPQQEASFKKAVSQTNKVLIVTGFHFIRSGNSNYIEHLTALLAKGNISHDVVEAENSDNFLVQLLESGNYQTLLFVHLDMRGWEAMSEMFGARCIGCLYNWIKFGGKFLVQGEGEGVSWLLQVLLSKPWHYCGDFYRRCKHSLNVDHFSHFPLLCDNNDTKVGSSSIDNGDNSDDETSELIMPSSINMKAVMLSGVAPEDQLFCPKRGARCVSAVPGFGGHIIPTFRTPIAATRHGKGLVTFIGDVNAEERTIRCMLSLIKLPLQE